MNIATNGSASVEIASRSAVRSTANGSRVTTEMRANGRLAVASSSDVRKSLKNGTGHDMKQALILCTGNSCRSQMAEGLWQLLGKGKWQAYSAGSRPTGKVHPLAIRAMKEIGIDIADFRSKPISEFENRPIDLAITVCDNAREDCPVYPAARSYLHWPFDDPADAQGTDEEKLVEFRRVRDEIRDRIERYLTE